MISIRRYFSSTKNRIASDPMQFVDDIYRYCLARGLGREDAEDVAIEVAQQSPVKPVANELRMYMIGMARRKIADHFRKKRPLVDGTSFSENSTCLNVDGKLDVQRVLNVLSETHRECLILKYVNGLSSEEIGEILEISSGGVDSLLQRARKSFASEWKSMHGDDHER